MTNGCCRRLPAKVCIARPYGCSDEPPRPDAIQPKPEPHEIAERIVDWFPHKAFTYDTYAKLKGDIANAIRNERSLSAVTRPDSGDGQ